MALVYLGISLANQEEHPYAHKLNFCTSEELSSVKVSHDEYALLLDSVKSLDFVKELTLISTCNRFELIVFVNDDSVSDESIAQINHAVKSVNKSNMDLSVLVNDEAKHHILRTYCGLNSGLLGEGEISLQMSIAFGQSRAMEYLSHQGMALLKQAVGLRELLDKNVYGEKVSYCDVGINSSLEKFGNFDYKKVVVLGSGSTARECCKSLVAKGVAPESIYLGHRISSSSDQVGQFKNNPDFTGMHFLRSKYGYHTDKIKALVADCDLLVFAIDSKNPVLNFSKNFKQRIIDFNSKPSCDFEEGTELSKFVSSQELDGFVRAYSKRRAKDLSFQAKIKTAETIIEDAVKSSDAMVALALN